MQDKSIMSASATQGGHKKETTAAKCNGFRYWATITSRSSVLSVSRDML